MDMKKILQAFDGAATKPVQGASDMKKFMSIVRESANPYKPVEENVITSFEEGSVGGDANAFLIAADKINDEVIAQVNKIKINADEALLRDMLDKFNVFMTAYHAVGKEILQPDMINDLPGDATSTDNSDLDEGVSEGWGAEKQQRDLEASNARWAPYEEKYADDPVMSDYFKFHRIYGGNTPEQAEQKALADAKAGKKLPDFWTNPKPTGGYKISSEGLSFTDYFNLTEAKKGL